MHDKILSLPSTSTVHAPQARWLQPFLVPERCKSSRIKSSRDTRASLGRSLCSPLMVIGISPHLLSLIPQPFGAKLDSATDCTQVRVIVCQRKEGRHVRVGFRSLLPRCQTPRPVFV